jgi:VWFA-related protein
MGRLGLLLLCLSWPSSSPAQDRVSIVPRVRAAPAKMPRADLRLDVKLVQIPVTVTDLRGKPLLDLGRNDFRIFEDDVEQQITAFSQSDSPISAGLVFDASRSMKNRIQDSRRAAEQFFHTSGPGDEFFLVKFSDRAELVTPFTRNLEAISQRLQSIDAQGWTALLDAIFLATHEVKRAGNQRKALVIFSDGADNNSRYSEAELLSIAREADVRVFAVSLFEHARFLERICDETGGQMIRVNKMTDLPDAMDQLSRQLRSEYLVGYTSKNQPNDGRYHKVRVEVRPPDGLARVRTSWRRGYMAPDE